VDQLIEDLRAIIGRDAVLAEADELLVYECDGLPQHKLPPRAVVFPRSTEEVSEALRVLAKWRVPFAPRGAGTGLSGGALACDRGVIIELARMRRLLKFDTENQQAIVETGFINAQLSRLAAAHHLYYAPDPSSQATCTIGGNIAENAGGIHCLKYGMTVDHVLAARVVLSDGQIIDLGNGAGDEDGYDLLGVFIGSEGTFGIATEATLRLLPMPASVRTLLADFADVHDASRAVSAIIAAGLVPAALEMIDGVTIRAVEASVFAAGIPIDAEAALLIELDGLEAGLDAEATRAESICREYGARNVRRAADEYERKKLWAARKGAFGAMGRLAPDLMLQDAVVPRSRLPEVLAEIYRIGVKYKLLVANVFHAGDGNLHPFICFDSRNADETKRVKEAGREIMETCVRAGGTITGEHGVGLDKSEYLPLIFTSNDMDAMLRVRAAFDPTGLCNPGKIIPTARSCGEARAAQAKTLSRPSNDSLLSNNNSQPQADVALSNESANAATHQTNTALAVATTSSTKFAAHRQRSFNTATAHHALAQIVGEANVCEASASHALSVAPANAAEACELLRLASREQWKIVPAGASLWLKASNSAISTEIIVSTRRMTRIIEHEPADLVASAEAGVPLTEFNAELARAGQWLPLDPPDDGRATLGGVAATGLGGAQSYGYGRPRGYVIGMRVALADGRIIKAGGRVVKNVAGYDLCKLFVGSYGTLGLILELTFKLRPLPARTRTLVATGKLSTLLDCASRIRTARLFPVALEIVSRGIAEKLGVKAGAGECALLVRFAGAAETLDYQTQQVGKLMGDTLLNVATHAQGDDETLWRELAAVPVQVAHQLVWRASVRPTELGSFLNTFVENEAEAFGDSLMWHACAGDGRVRVMCTPPIDTNDYAQTLRQARNTTHAAGGMLCIDCAPLELKNKFSARDVRGASTSLMERIKQQLDAEELFSTKRIAVDQF